jgi:hypothetical protein
MVGGMGALEHDQIGDAGKNRGRHRGDHEAAPAVHAKIRPCEVADTKQRKHAQKKDGVGTYRVGGTRSYNQPRKGKSWPSDAITTKAIPATSAHRIRLRERTRIEKTAKTNTSPPA